MKTAIFVIALLCTVAAFTSAQTSTASAPTATSPNPSTSQTNPATDPTSPTVSSAKPTTGSTASPSEPTSQTTSTTQSLTTKGSSTTAQPTTTPNPKPANDYEVFNKTVCLKAKFSAQFEHGKEVWNVGGDAKVDNGTSNCGRLSVNFASGTFHIDFDHDKSVFYISKVSASLPNNTDVTSKNLTTAKASNGSSYLCNSGFDIALGPNVTMKLKNVQLQAFYVKDGDFGAAMECTADFPDNLLVPIAVGCALGGLIVVVLIAYCILRARATRNYDPVRNSI